MCIFSHDVQQVSNTKIYARLNGDRQHLVYEMRLTSESDVAMILPLPTQLPSTDQVSFVNLSGYDGFFRDMDQCFPQPLEVRSRGIAFAGASPRNLMVHRVGAFDASFVPALADFHRLDLRFRLPEDVWKQLPLYSDFGFAVFQLRSGDMRIHPMALSFRTRNSTALFFPTAHVHDGSVHPVAQFDHSLYAQAERPNNVGIRRGDDPPVANSIAEYGPSKFRKPFWLRRLFSRHGSISEWVHGSVLPCDVMNFGNSIMSDKTKGLVDPLTPVARCKLAGPWPNRDTWLPV
jgi:hypothetical protein